MGIVDYFAKKYAEFRSKHQTHQRIHVKGRRRNMHTGLRPIENQAGTKLAKRFAKGHTAKPRGY